MSIYVVIGPPGAGDSSYVRGHAKAGDITIDFDALAESLTPNTPDAHVFPEYVRVVAGAAWRAAVDTALDMYPSADVYIIHADPGERMLARYMQYGAEIVMLGPDHQLIDAATFTRKTWWN